MATQIAEQENSYQSAFVALQENSSSNDWLCRLRENAMERFAELGFPSTKDEEWKYTNIAPLTRESFSVAAAYEEKPSVRATDLEDFTYKETSTTQLVFVNGSLRKDLSSLDGIGQDVVAVDLRDALVKPVHEQIIRRYLAHGADFVANGFAALNTAFLSGGAFVHIPKSVAPEKPIHLLFLTDGREARPVVTFPRVLLVAEANSSATVIESYGALANERYFTNSVVEIFLQDGARLQHHKVQRESLRAFHVANTVAELGPSSSYDATTITFGAELSRHDLGVTMDHEGAECWLDGLYLIGAGQHADTHSVIDHRKPNCSSHQLYKGILDGKSRAVFNGKIFVRPGAQKTDAMQTNKNLLLSREARVDTKPQLEIFADDVKCAHGAAVGQLDEEEIFYLRTRGIGPDLARNVLTYGFAEEVVQKIKLDSIREQIEKTVLNRLGAQLEA